MSREVSPFELVAELYNRQFSNQVQHLLLPIYEKYRNLIDAKAVAYARNVIGDFGDHDSLMKKVCNLAYPYFEVRSRMTFDEAQGYGFLNPRYYGPVLDISFDHINNQAFQHWPMDCSADRLFQQFNAIDSMNYLSKASYIKIFSPEVIDFAKETGFPVIVFADNLSTEMIVTDRSKLSSKKTTCFSGRFWNRQFLQLHQDRGEYSVFAVRVWDQDSKTMKLVK